MREQLYDKIIRPCPLDVGELINTDDSEVCRVKNITKRCTAVCERT